ncbi:MAG: DUF1697 domain-containing protein [Gemmatimonadota bacterium]
MPRYAAFLRGVMPTNAKMPELKRAFEAAGFQEVVTILGTGNVAFDARAAGTATLARKAEAAMEEVLGRTFATIVRPMAVLQELLASDPYAPFDLTPGSKRVVTFLPEPPKRGLRLPIEEDGARILVVNGTEAFSAYVASPKGPVFMTLIERAFGKNVTTRTWDTVVKVARR